MRGAKGGNCLGRKETGGFSLFGSGLSVFVRLSLLLRGVLVDLRHKEET